MPAADIQDTTAEKITGNAQGPVRLDQHIHCHKPRFDAWMEKIH